MFRKVSVLVLIALLAVFAVCAANAEEFSLRGGVKFGMSPEEVIAIEASNGFYHDLTSKGDMLYKHTTGYQLYFEDKGVGKLGNLSIMRFEYDFDLVTKKMYQFYYVIRESGAYSYLLPSLTAKYGEPTRSGTLMTEKFSEVSSHLNHGHWEVEYDDEIIVIDLWDNSYGTCFLVYQSFSPRQLQTEQESLDFGL